MYFYVMVVTLLIRCIVLHCKADNCIKKQLKDKNIIAFQSCQLLAYQVIFFPAVMDGCLLGIFVTCSREFSGDDAWAFWGRTVVGTRGLRQNIYITAFDSYSSC